MNIHPQAQTTPQIRAEIHASSHLSQKTLAQKYNVTEQTIRKWQKLRPELFRKRVYDLLGLDISDVY